MKSKLLEQVSLKEFSEEAKLVRSKKLSIPLFVYKQTNNCSEPVLIYISDSYTKLAKELGISRATISKVISNNDNLLFGQFKITKNLDSSVERSLMSADQLKEQIAEIRSKNRINNLKDYGKGKQVIITNLTDNICYSAPNLISAVSYLNQVGVQISYQRLSNILIKSNYKPYTFKEGFRIERVPS